MIFKDRLPSKVVFHQRSYSVKGHLPSKVIFRQRLSSVKGRLPSNVVLRQRSSSVKGRPPVHWLWLYSCLVSESSNYKLGRLDKVLVLQFALTATSQPRYRFQDGSWPNHKKHNINQSLQETSPKTDLDRIFVVQHRFNI